MISFQVGLEASDGLSMFSETLLSHAFMCFPKVTRQYPVRSLKTLALKQVHSIDTALPGAADGAHEEVPSESQWHMAETRGQGHFVRLFFC